MIVALIGFGLLLLLAAVGIPLGFAMMSIGLVGFGLLRGWEPALSMVTQQILSLGLNPGFAVLPLFILMGGFVARAKLSDDLYDATNSWFGHFRGGLAMATVAACGGFATICGSSTATALTMGKVAIPSMRRFNYADGLSLGAVAAGGTLGFMFPPSIAMIIYGLLTSSDIAQLFLAGILPGLATIGLYMLAIAIVVWCWPAMGPAAPRASWKERFQFLFKIWGVLVLFLFILGGLFLGVFTTTEAGGMGAVGALLFALGRRKIGWQEFFRALTDAGRTTAMVFTVAFGTLVLNQFVNISGLPHAIIGFLTYLGIGHMATMVVILCIYVILGMVVEGIGMIFLTVPIFVPIVQAMGFDLIWFGVVVVMIVEISLLMPPIGLNIYIMKAIAPETPLSVIFRGVAPFILAEIAALAVVLIFPAIALFLPKIMS